MNPQLGLIVLILIVVALYSPIHFLNSKVRRFADEDLKKMGPDEWHKQLRWNAYSKLIGRQLIALACLGMFVNALRYAADLRLGPLQVFLLILSAAFSLFGFWRFVIDKKILSDAEN